MTKKAIRRSAKRLMPRRAEVQGKQAGPAIKPAEVVTLSKHDELVAVKRSLEAVALALNGVDPKSLSDSEHKTFVDEVNKVDLAIARVRNSLLEGIVAEFEAAMTEIQSATAGLEDDLAKLKQSVDVINAVAGTLGVIEKIIALGR